MKIRNVCWDKCNFNFLKNNRKMKISLFLLLIMLIQARAEVSFSQPHLYSSLSLDVLFNNDVTLISQQTGQVQGTVKDETGMPVIGANVYIKGTTIGTVTDADGRFTINTSSDDVLIFSYIGMHSVEMVVDNQDVIDVVLREDTTIMDELVVIGYGTVKKSNLSGAVSTVSAKDLQKLPAANVSQALQGNASGLYSLESDRSPGAGVTLNIRGNNSFSGGQPLFIVDGFPIASGGGIQAINPNDIESISILKDASSTAIYGARAANGVVLVTTKMGKQGKPVFEVDVYNGFKYFNNPIETMNAEQFAALRRESYEMDGIPIPSNAFLDTELEMLNRGKSTDWWNEVTKQYRQVQNYQVAFRAGTENTRIHLGAGIFDEKGIVNNSHFTRGTLRVNISQNFGKFATLSSYNNLSIMSNRGSNATNVLFPAVVGNPMSPVRDKDGEYYAMIQNALGTPRANPAAFSDLPRISIIEPLINSSLALDLNFTQDLKFRSQISGEIDNYRYNFYNPRSISGQDEINGRISDGYASITSSVNYNWISENTLTYNKLFNDQHHIDAVIGFSAQKNRWETVSASASGFASDIYESYNLGAGSAEARKPSSDLTNWSMLSYIGRIIYTLKDRYIFTANMRIDGSSRFGKDNKYGYFPSGAFAWRLSEENFIKDLDIFSDLKFRVSYGFTGNANAISPYQTLPKLSYAPYNFDGREVAGYYESNMPSPNLKWESTEQANIGLDISLFSNRLNFVVDYYRKNTKDLIRAIDIPAVAGFPSTYVNLGNLQNNGLELEARSVNFDGPFVWRTAFMIAFNKNKLTSLGDGSEKIGTTHWVGKPLYIGNRYMIEAIGIWQTEEEKEASRYGAVPGDVKYRDINDDGVIDDQDRDFVGSYYPNFYGSLSNEFSYKSFDLNIFMTFQQGRDVYNGNNYILLSGAGVDNNRIEMLNRWTPTNPSQKYPRASASGGNRLSTETSEFLEDASFLKIKNITLGYTLPPDFLQRYYINRARFYVGVTNLFTFTKYTGMDPEDGDIWNNTRQSSYPITTTYTLGLQLQF